MKRSRGGLLIVALCLVANHSAAQEPQDTASHWALGNATNVAKYDGLDSVGSRVPDWNHGWVVRLEGPLTGPDGFSVFSQSGRRERVAKVRLPGAIQINLSHATAGADGSVFVSGYAILDDRSVEYFVGRTLDDGSVTDSLLTSPFAPMCICTTPDGSVWALGGELDKHALGEDYTLVRRFTPGKGLAGQALRHSSFPRHHSPIRMVSLWAPGPPGAAWLRCDSKRVYLYADDTDELIEIDAEALLVRRWRIDTGAVGGAKVVGFAVTESGGIFASLMSLGAGPSSGHLLGLYALDKNEFDFSATWMRIAELPDDSLGAVRLWGADGDQLILQKTDEPVGTSLHWTDVSRAALLDADR